MEYLICLYYMSVLKYTNNILSQANNSPVIAGVSMLFLNIGSKYIDIGLSKTQEKAIKNGIAKEILIFSIVFVATKDILLSMSITLVYFILTNFIFNEKSRFCAAPKFFNKLMDEIDVNGDNIISDEEIERAVEILKQSSKQKQQQPSQQKPAMSSPFISSELWGE